MASRRPARVRPEARAPLRRGGFRHGEQYERHGEQPRPRQGGERGAGPQLLGDRAPRDRAQRGAEAGRQAEQPHARVEPVDIRLFRVDLLTHAKEQVTLPAGFDNFYIYQGTDGNVYCTQSGNYLRIDGLTATAVPTRPDEYGKYPIPGLSLDYDWVEQTISYSRAGGTEVQWIDSGDAAAGLPDPRDELRRFYRIKY